MAWLPIIEVVESDEPLTPARAGSLEISRGGGAIQIMASSMYPGGLQSSLTQALYATLRREAERHLRLRLGRATAGLTWQPTALVNETLLRMIQREQRYDSDGQFLALASTIMRCVLVDYIRERTAQKRGGGCGKIEFDPEVHGPLALENDRPLDVETILEAIEQLAELYPRKGQIARLRLVFGMTVVEMAQSLRLSSASIERDWRFAKAWLRQRLSVVEFGEP